MDISLRPAIKSGIQFMPTPHRDAGGIGWYLSTWLGRAAGHGRYFAQSPQSFAEYAVVGVGKSFGFTEQDWQRSCLKICGGLVSRISRPKRTTMKPVRQILVGLSLALVGLLFVPLAKADGIVVTDTTTGSGSLDGTVFINALVTLTFVGDTTNVTGTTIFQLPGTATLSVGGIGSDTFTDNIQVVVNQTFTDGGFGDFTNSAAIIFTFNPAFATYSLTSSIGPLSGSSALGLPSVDNTVHGTFNLKSAGTSTFTATVTTPEPSLLFMVGTGLLALVGLSWRRNSLATCRSVLSYGNYGQGRGPSSLVPGLFGSPLHCNRSQTSLLTMHHYIRIVALF
jgi:hypothetical protein